jgi:hypothetical protein
MDSAEPMFGTKYGGTPMTADEKCGAFAPERLADWLIEYHGAKDTSRQTIISNIKSAYQAERAVGFIEGRSKADVHISFSLFGSRKDK